MCKRSGRTLVLLANIVDQRRRAAVAANNRRERKMTEGLSRSDANILMMLLEVATGNDWPRTATYIQQFGYTPKQVSDAWKKLEKLAGMSGTVPEESDF